MPNFTQTLATIPIGMIRKFFNDLGHLPRFEFFQKYILPLLASFFTWGILNYILLYSLSFDSLTTHTGKVQTIEIVEKSGIRYTNYPLIIKLNSDFQEFRIADRHEAYFSTLGNKIQPNDEITIYTKPKWISYFTWGKRNDIMQIEKDNKVIFSIEVYKKDGTTQVIIISIFAIIFWVWYIAFRRLKKNSS